MQHTLSRHWLHSLAIAVLLALAGMANAAAPLPPPGALSGENALKLIRSQGRKLAIIDVRTPAEFDKGHLPGAALLPVQELEQNLDKIPDGPVLLVCRTGRRAGDAFGIIRKARPGKENLWYLKGTPVYHSDGTYEFR